MDEEDAMKEMKKKTNFKRMNAKSMKLLTNMARNPETKQLIESKKVAVVSRWRDLGAKAKLQNARENMNKDAADGDETKKKTSVANLFVEAARAMKAKEERTKAEAHVHREESKEDLDDGLELGATAAGYYDQGDYETIPHLEVHETKFTEVNEAGSAKHEQRQSPKAKRHSASPQQEPRSAHGFRPIPTKDQEENGENDENGENIYDDVANQIGIPKVENDEWPEEELYTNVSGKIDVLF